MSVERKTWSLEIGDRTVTVKELTVGELERWVLEQSDANAPAEASIVRGGIIAGLSLADIARMCDVPVDAMVEMPPSEVQLIADHCVEVNRHFFAMLDRIEKARAAGAGSTPNS